MHSAMKFVLIITFHSLRPSAVISDETQRCAGVIPAGIGRENRIAALNRATRSGKMKILLRARAEKNSAAGCKQIK